MVLRGTSKIFNDWFGEIIIVIEKNEVGSVFVNKFLMKTN